MKITDRLKILAEESNPSSSEEKSLRASIKRDMETVEKYREDKKKVGRDLHKRLMLGRLIDGQLRTIEKSREKLKKLRERNK